jgi:hypothetical protein
MSANGFGHARSSLSPVRPAKGGLRCLPDVSHPVSPQAGRVTAPGRWKRRAGTTWFSGSCVSSESRVIVANSAAGSRSVSQSAASCSRPTTCVRQCGSWAAGDRGGCQPPAALLCRLADALVGDDSVDFAEEGRNEVGAALDANCHGPDGTGGTQEKGPPAPLRPLWVAAFIAAARAPARPGSPPAHPQVAGPDRPPSARAAHVAVRRWTDSLVKHDLVGQERLSASRGGQHGAVLVIHPGVQWNSWP